MSFSLKNKLERILNNEDQDDKLLLDRVRDLVCSYENEHPETDNTSSIGSLFSEYLNSGSDDQSDGLITSDFEELDEHKIFTKGEFVVIGGRPSMGKTQLLINLALNMSAKVPVLYLSFDQSKSAVVRRMISNLTEIDVSLISQGNLNQLQVNMVKGVEKEFEGRKLFINDSSYSTVRSVRDLCRKHIEKNGVQVILIDYLQLLSSERYRHNRELEIAYVCRTLKDLARRNNVLVVVSSQLSRSVEYRGGDKRPQLSDLRESGAIEQDADKVLFIYRPEYYGFTHDEYGNPTKGLVELILAKNRSGNLEQFNFKRNQNFTRLMTFTDHLEQFRIMNERLNDLDNMDEPF